MLIRGKYIVVLPGRGENGGIIVDGAVYVKDKSITDIGKFDVLRRRYPQEDVFGSPNHAVIPGFVNAHHHGRGMSSIEMGLPDDSLELFMFSLVGEPWTDPGMSAHLSALKLTETGVTTVVHSHRHYGPPGKDLGLYREVLDKTFEGYLQSGIRVAFALDAKDRPGLVYGDHSPFLSILPDSLRASLQGFVNAYQGFDRRLWFKIFDEAVTRCKNTRIRMLLGPFTAHSLTEAFLLELMKKGRDLGTFFHMHALETQYNVGYARRYLGKPQLEYFRDMGFLGPDVTLVHGVWVSEDDIHILAESGVSVVTCPSSNLRLKSGIAPLDHLLNAGVNLGIGMDGITINDEEDVFQEMRLVRNLHRVPGHDERCPNALEVFRMATEGGARAAGLWDLTGSITIGKSADLVLIRLDELVTPFMKLPDQFIEVMVLRGRPRHVETVVVDGEILYHEGRHLRGDPALLRRQIAQTALDRFGTETKNLQELMEKVLPYVIEFYRDWAPPASEPYYRFNRRN